MLPPPVSPPETGAGAAELRCWLSLPPQGGARAGILVLPEIFGVNAWLRRVADRLAGEGYLALAVPLFSRTAPELELGYDEDAVREGRSHKERTTAAGILADLARAADWLRQTFPELPPGLGCVGFCFGGHGAMLAAGLPQVRASCDFYGAGVVSGRPGGGPPTLRDVEAIEGRLLCVFGNEDPLIPPAEVAAVGAALASASAGRPAGLEHRLLILQAGHGFLCEDRADHRPAAAAAGWRAMLEFFRESLG
jgi:carboxymethylenebutenolidase